MGETLPWRCTLKVLLKHSKIAMRWPDAGWLAVGPRLTNWRGLSLRIAEFSAAAQVVCHAFQLQIWSFTLKLNRSSPSDFPGRNWTCRNAESVLLDDKIGRPRLLSPMLSRHCFQFFPIRSIMASAEQHDGKSRTVVAFFPWRAATIFLCALSSSIIGSFHIARSLK